MRRLTTGVILALALGTAACGSTVPTTAGGTGAPGATDGGLGLAPADAATSGGTAADIALGSAPASAVGGTGSSGSGTTAGGPAAPGAATGGATATTGGAAAGSAVNGRGVTDTTITIGAAIPTGTEAVGETFGISGAGSVPEEKMWQAVVTDVNRTGGVLGRKLVLYNHSVDFAAYIANPSQTYGEICADFKDDHKVFAALIYIVDPDLRSCLAKMGSPFIVYGSFSTLPEAAFGEHGGNYLYAPSGISHERLADLFVESLLANDFTATWNTTAGGPGVEPVRLGLIHADTPDQNNLYGAYARELAKRGLRFADTVTYSGSASDALAATKSAVLRFKANGITHVFGASAFFLRDAESQSYRPRYAYLPGLGSIGAANSPPEQLRGAQTVGWAPLQDVNGPEDPGKNPGAPRCDSAMKAAGLVTGSNRTDLKLMYAVCDAVYSFRDAMSTGAAASVAGLRRGYESLGTRFPTSLTFASVLSPTRHYGVSAVRDMAYDTACSCLKYTSRSNRS